MSNNKSLHLEVNNAEEPRRTSLGAPSPPLTNNKEGVNHYQAWVEQTIGITRRIIN
jgi:hypothetical protein